MKSSPFPITLLTLLLALTACGGRSGSGSQPDAERPDPAALRTQWRWIAPHPSYVGMPGVDGSGVALTFGHSHLVLFDPDGRPRWTVDRPNLRDVPPRLNTDSVLVATEDGVVAFDRADGATRWAATVGDRANSPVVAGGRVVVSTWDGSLVGIDRADGRVVWRTPLPGFALGPPAAVGPPGGGGNATVVVSWEAQRGDGAGVVAVDAATGRSRWTAPLPAGGTSGPGVVAVPGGGPPVVVVVAADLAAHGLDAESGHERWKAGLEGAGSPEVAPLDAGGGTVLVAHRLGGMATLDAADGRVRWHVTSDGAAERGGPAGPGPGGRFALPLEDGRLLVAGPGRATSIVDPPGRVSGVAEGPDRALLVGLRETTDNDLTASTGW